MFLFRAKVTVATDPNMGLGLFATEFIPKDSIVWEFVEGVDIKVSVKRVEQMSRAQREYFDKYTWIEGDYYIGSCDLTSFINHSYYPNIKIIGEVMISARDIEIGEELFENYQEFDPDFETYQSTLL